jgi:hypothetical protein
MGTMRTFLGAVIASGLLFGNSIGARAQSMDEERAATRAHIAAHGRGSILARTTVLDSPFSGDAVTTWRPPSGSGRHEVTGTARFYRDSAGRVRVEQTLLGSGTKHRQRIIVTPDPAKAWAYLLDPAAHTASRMSRSGAPSGAGGAVHFVLPVAPRCVIALFRPGLRRPLEEESLGEQTIHGLRVEGTRIRGILPAALGRGETRDERWFSPELQLEMQARSEDAELGVVEFELTITSRDEPPAALFEIPAGYDVGEPVNGASSLNPYATEAWPKLSSSFKSSCGSAKPPGF